MNSARKHLSAFLLLMLIMLLSADLFAVAGPFYHVVDRKETLWHISKRYDIDIRVLKRANGLKYPYRLSVGQKILIPGKTEISADLKRSEVEKAWNAVPAKRSRWLYVVVHHSGTDGGNAAAFEKYHRYKRHMEHGLAYHFVIDNGIGGADGRIEVGNRWRTQWEGGHTSNKIMNKVGVGICLVGNFERSYPTKKQLKSLCRLIKYLQRKFNIKDRNVILHREVIQRRTECPGRKFPQRTFKRMLRETA